MKNIISHTQDLCLCALDTNLLCVKMCAEMRIRMKGKQKRKEVVIVALLCVMLSSFLLMGCDKKDVADKVQNIVDANDEHVQGVKNGHPKVMPDITYGEAFESFFSNPTWKYFESTDGEDVVEFTGRCEYQKKEVKARLQFILDKDGESFEQGALEFNDVPQNALITSALIYKAFEEYANDHDIKISDDLEDAFVPDDDSTDDTEDVTSEEMDDSTYDTSSEETDVSDDDLDYDDTEDESSEYVFPDSDTRKLTKADIKGKSKEELRIGRNEIYARHGRCFVDQELQDYFESTSWYEGYIAPEDFVESEELNAVERRNARYIKKFE